MALWIESHADLGRHPKTARLAKLLGISKVTVIGHLHYLWWWCMDYAQDGELGKYTVAEIADAAMWEGDAEVFQQALIDARFLDEFSECQGIAVHDWQDYGGKLLQKRRVDAARKSAARAKDPNAPSAGHPPDIRVTAQVEESRVEETRKEESRTAKNGTTRSAAIAHADDDPPKNEELYRFQLNQHGATAEEIAYAEGEMRRRGAASRKWTAAYMWPIIRDLREQKSDAPPPSKPYELPPIDPVVAMKKAREEARRLAESKTEP